MKDHLEMMEDAAERKYFEMLQPNGMLKCQCGRLFKPNDGEVVSPSPYAMPVCPNCFKKWVETT